MSIVAAHPESSDGSILTVTELPQQTADGFTHTVSASFAFNYNDIHYGCESVSVKLSEM